MRKNIFFSIIVGILLFLSIKSTNLESEPLLLSTGKYTLADILDAANRVKNYVLKYKDIPKTVQVSSDELTMVQFTYSMGVAIKNINENKNGNEISTIKLNTPTTPHRCNIKVYLEDYIDAIGRVLKYSEEHGAAPAYVMSYSVEIGYREYAYGFSKILVFYMEEKALPLYCVFDSSVFDKDDPNQEIKGVDFVKGINERNSETDVNKYIKETNNNCYITETIKDQTKKVTSGCTTTLQKARAIFNFVKNQITYKYYSNSQNGASKTLVNGRGNCCDMANLIVAMCRYSGIPVRYSHGQDCYFYYSGNYYGHVWAQILIGNIWYAADATSGSNSLGFIKNWNYKNFNSLRQYALLPF